MAKQLLSVYALILCLACGLEDSDSASKFISKTQNDPANNLTTGNKHRPFGAHANAYLINRVHVEDNDGLSEISTGSENCLGNRLAETCNLTADVFVGYWWEPPDPLPDECSCGFAGIWEVGTPLPLGCCTLRFCLSNAATEVESAIDKWLAPLRTPYGDDDNPIVSNSSTDLLGTYTSGGKSKPDLVINFVCGQARDASDWKFPDSDNDDCPSSAGTSGKSCTRYDTSSDGNLASDKILPSPSDDMRNIPIVYIGDGDIPAENQKNDAMEEHDRLDLLHEIGHAFGLADTHRSTDKTIKIGKQPRSIMARDRIFVRGAKSLVLGHDDKVGVQWLYEHHRNGVSTRNCFLEEEYVEKNYNTDETPSQTYVGCELRYPLITALKNRNSSEAISIIDTNTDFNINAIEASTGNSALHYAIIQHVSPHNSATDTDDYLTVIRKIIAYNGLNINIKDNLGKTPMHLAVQYDKQEVVIKLLSATGMRVQEADNNNNTPLHYAADLGHSYLVSAMRASFSSYVGAKNAEGRTAIHLAAENGHTDTVRAFATYPRGIGGLSGAEDNDGNTALHLAAENGHTDVVAVILQNDKTLLNDDNNHDETPLHLAAKLGRTATVTSLLQQTSIEVNPQNDQGNTPLHLAALNDRPEIVTLLLNKNGIDTAILNSNRKTARDEAISRNHTDVIAVFDGGNTIFGTSSAQRLLQALKVGNVDPDNYCGASDDECRQRSALAIIRADQNLDVNYVEVSTGNTALHYAVRGDDDHTANTRGPYELVVDLLLRRTLIKPNITNAVDSAPLHLAVEYDKIEIVKLLLRNRHLNVNIANNIGETALHIAVDLEYEDIVAALLLYRLGNIDVNLQNDAGQAPLHVAAEQRSPVATQMLVDDRRVDVNLRTRDAKETALHIAAEYNNDKVVRALLSDADIDVNTQDATGSTALHIAAHHGSEQVVTILLDVADIDLTILDNQQLSAYSRAEANEQTRVVDIFDNQNKGDDVVFRGTLMEELRDKKASTDVEDVALDILDDNEDDLDVNEKDSHSGKTPLHYAIEYEYKRLITKLLARSDLQVNLKNKDGETPLISAVRLKQTQTITALLRHSSIKVNEQNGNGDTALLIAVRAQAQQVMTLLSGHNNIDANRKDRAGNTPLHLAVNSKHSGIVRALLNAAGIDVNLKDSSGNTALHTAVKNKDTAIVTQLVAVLGINANHKDRAGNTPLHLAVNSKHSSIVRALLTIPTLDANLSDSDSKTALHIAVDNNDEAAVNQLLSHSGIAVNLVVTGITGETALNIAIAQHIDTTKNYGKVIDLLLAHTDIDPNIKNNHQESPLLKTVKEEETAIVIKLLAHTDIETNTSNSSQKTALMFAAERGSEAIVQQLLAQEDIDINLQNDNQFTALHFAAHRGHVEIVRLLLAHIGINITLKDKWNLTPRARAKNRKHNNVVAVFDEYEAGNIGNAITLLAELARGDRENSIMTLIATNQGSIAINAKDDTNNYTALHYAAKLGYTRVVNTLLEYDSVNVNAASTREKRPLHLAARRGHHRVVQALLAHKSIQTNVRDDRNATPLHHAVSSGSYDTVQALLGHEDIRPTLITSSGYTALHWAAQLGYDRIITALLDKASSLINIKTDRGRSALYYAAWFGHQTAVQELLGERDININLRDEGGDTALHKVATYNRLAIARLLLDAGASIQISNKQRKKARDVAQDKGFTDMVELIDSY